MISARASLSSDSLENEATRIAMKTTTLRRRKTGWQSRRTETSGQGPLAAQAIAGAPEVSAFLLMIHCKSISTIRPAMHRWWTHLTLKTTTTTTTTWTMCHHRPPKIPHPIQRQARVRAVPGRVVLLLPLLRCLTGRVAVQRNGTSRRALYVHDTPNGRTFSLPYACTLGYIYVLLYNILSSLICKWLFFFHLRPFQRITLAPVNTRTGQTRQVQDDLGLATICILPLPLLLILLNDSIFMTN